MIPAGIAGIPDILSGLTARLSHLVRTEFRLAKAEMTGKATAMATALIPAVVGAVLLIPVLVILLQAAATGLVEAGMSGSMALLLVGGVGLIVVLVLFGAGMSRLKQVDASPHRTMRQLRRDADVVKDQVA